MRKHALISYITIWLLIISLLISIFNIKFWKQEGQVIKWDIIEYYGYLPSTFIYHDLTLSYTQTPGIDWGKRIWALTAPNGKYVFKMTMGMSVMYAPFFGLAHAYSHAFGYPADGYSSPYKFALLMSSVFYLFFGLYYLRKLLLMYFNDIVTSLTMIMIVAGTNFWYYASFEAPMSHAYSFSLITIFIWLTIKFYQKPKWNIAIGLGLLYGLISLIRPSNAIVALIFILWDLSSWAKLKERLIFFFKNFHLLVLLAICSFIIWTPQFLYWHKQAGHWLYFSYAENGAFYFSHPQIINGLFSYRKGWFLYSPIMLVAVLSIPLCVKYARPVVTPLIIFLPLNIYIIFSWWCWWYGGCYGQRSFIDTFALMAFPLAACLQWLWQKQWTTKLISYGLISACTFMGMIHTAKYYYGSIHWDSMTKEAYWGSFRHLRPGPGFQEQIKEPDYDKALRGEEEYNIPSNNEVRK